MQQLQPTFISELIEQVLDRIAIRLSTLSDKQLTDEEFIELKSLFQEDIVFKALHILDTGSVTSYVPQNGISELIEIQTSLWRSPIVYKLFPNVNFCKCKFFTNHVLNAVEKLYYTCEHVLAARLARILDKLKVEVIPKHTFNFLLKQIAAD